jgi:hypothetical protein
LRGCQQENEACEINGLLYYPKCAAGYHNVGCCVCSRNCPDGFSDEGIFCKRTSKGYIKITIRTFSHCDSSEDHIGDKYMPKCWDNFTPYKNFCFGNCPLGYNLCGGICVNGTCTEELQGHLYYKIHSMTEILTSKGWGHSETLIKESGISICN